MELKKYFIPIVDRHIKIRLYIFPYFFILLYLSIFRFYIKLTSSKCTYYNNTNIYHEYETQFMTSIIIYVQKAY